MSIAVRCKCGRTVNFRDEQAGATAACLYCGARVQIPGTPPPAPAGIRCPRCGKTAPPGSARCPACERALDGSPASTPAGAIDEARRMYEKTPRDLDARLAKRLELAVLHGRDRDKGRNIPGHRAVAHAEMERSLRESPLVVAHVLRANTDLFEPGNERRRASVVFSLDPARRFDAAYLAAIATALSANAKAHPRDAALSAVREPFVDDNWQGCAPIPPSLRGAGTDAFVADACIEPRFLPGFCLQEMLIPAIANPRLQHFRNAFVIHV